MVVSKNGIDYLKVDPDSGKTTISDLLVGSTSKTNVLAKFETLDQTM